MTTEVAIVEAPPHPMMLLQKLIESGADPEKLGKMMDLAERYEKRTAETAFNDAMSACQAEMPAILKDKKNDNTGKMYARYETLNFITKPIYTKHGFSLNWTEGPPREDGQVHVICDVRHSAGHMVTHNGYFGLDDAGAKGTPNKTKVQAKGSTYSYGRRYLEKFIWNLAEADEDTDGNSNDYITKEEEKIIEELFKESQEACRRAKETNPAIVIPTLTGFLKWLKVDGVDLIGRSQFATAVNSLRNKIKEATAHEDCPV